ncbi:Hypothetical protein ABZS17G119_02217 [Kosakonia cowanii]
MVINGFDPVSVRERLLLTVIDQLTAILYQKFRARNFKVLRDDALRARLPFLISALPPLDKRLRFKNLHNPHEH